MTAVDKAVAEAIEVVKTIKVDKPK